MEKIIEIERAVKNFSRVWHNFTPEEKDEIGAEIAAKINKLNSYQKSETWRRIHKCNNILYYIAPYLNT